MTYTQLNIDKDPHLGILCFANEKILLVPYKILGKDIKAMEKTLKVDAKKISISGTSLIGLFVAGNSKALILPTTTLNYEKIALEDSPIEITVFKSKLTALGNLIVCNDYGAIISPYFSSEERKEISKILGVQVEIGTIAGIGLPGSLALATNKGVVVSPEIKEREENLLEKVLNVPIEKTTVFGSQFVKAGLVANSKGAVIGNMTTPEENIALEEALFRRI